jgi:isocitrate dehydrogenase
MPARFQKSDEITVNNPHSTPAIGHVQREIAVTLRRNVGHALVKSPVTITRNTQFLDESRLAHATGLFYPRCPQR